MFFQFCRTLPSVSRRLFTFVVKKNALQHSSYVEEFPYLMQPFSLFAGSQEVNGTYAFAKKIKGVNEFWYVQKIKKRKGKVIERIFKIRGNGHLPEMGDNFRNCWILQHSYHPEKPPIQFYAAPMKSLKQTYPPKEGWVCIGGIQPSPIIMDVNINQITEEFNILSNKIEKMRETIALIKEDDSKTPANCPQLKEAISKLKKLQPVFDSHSYQLMCNEYIPKKAWEELRFNLDKLASYHFIYGRSAEIYGGCAGLYDFGPMGAAIKNNILQEWRQHFIIADRMLQIESCMLTPRPVLVASGHVAKFSDFMMRDAMNGNCYRADHLLEQYIDGLLESEAKLKMTEEEIEEHKLIRESADTYDIEKLGDLIKNVYKIKSPETGNELNGPKEFNLMFSTQIGPTGKIPGFLRPETAQGIFTNFHKLLLYNSGRMPFAAAQIGHSFRNEIAPRGGLIRVREFQMAEIEHFCEFNAREKLYSKFKFVENVKMKFLPACNQTGMKDDDKYIECTIGEACSTNINVCPLPSPIRNTTLGYYLARTQLFFDRIGIDTKCKLRFRQHMNDEMAHYAQDCWDAELLTSMGWIECVGHADRACFDLSQHSNATGVKLEAEEIFDEPLMVEYIRKSINFKLIGKLYKSDSKPLIKYLQSLSDEDALQLRTNLELNKNGCEIIRISKIEYKVTCDMFKIRKESKQVHSRKYVPSVVEPSFGIGRILYALLEHSIWERVEDEHRVVLSLKPKIAPYQVSVLPLSTQLNEVARNVESILLQQTNEWISVEHKENESESDEESDHWSTLKDAIPTFIDESSAAIGRKYSRCDSQGIPFAVTIDFQTVKDDTVTVRERDSQLPQIRVHIKDLYQLVSDLGQGRMRWSKALKLYPHHTQQHID